MQAQTPLLWSSEREKAFLDRLTIALVAGYTNYTLPVPGGRLSSGLAQVQDGLGGVIFYANRGLGPEETKYPVGKAEFLALKSAVTDKFYNHLYGQRQQPSKVCDNHK